MPNYSVTIKATITKTYNVRAPDEELANELAHQIFSDEHDTWVEQETEDLVEISDDIPTDGDWTDADEEASVS